MMKMIGNRYHIMRDPQSFTTIRVYVKLIEKDKKGAIATIRVIPQMMYFLFFVFPLLKNNATAKPTNTIDIAKKIASISYLPFI